MRADPAGWPYQDPGGDDPDWTGGNDHPDWTSHDDNWPPGGAAPGWPYGEDHPSWPAGSDHPDWPRGGGSALLGRGPSAKHYDGHWPPEPAAWVPATDGLDEVQQWSGQQAAAPGGFRSEDSVQLADRIMSDAGTVAASVRQEAMEQADAIREAAEREAEEIRRQAAYEADAAREAEWRAEELKRQAAEQAEAMREAAFREADELRADAIRLSAELGEVAAYVTRTLPMPAIPGPEPQAQFRQHVAGDFALPATPAEELEARAAARPQAPSGQYYIEDLDGQARSGGRPRTWEQETWEPEAWPPPAEPDDVWLPVSPEELWPTRPARPSALRPATRPDGRPSRRTHKPTRSRQSRSLRAFAGTITALVLLALGTGAYQLATRGFTFFVFRSAGTGATDNNAIFPGVIPTPKPSPAHHHSTTGPRQHGARRTRHHPKSTAGR
jgi:hypothetical protein